MRTYRVFRLFRDSDERRLIDTGLSLEEAQAHCSDPESSSTTAESLKAFEETFHNGPWFDAYSEEC